MNIYEALNRIVLSLFLDDSLKWEDYHNDSKRISKNYEATINNEHMIFACSIIKKRVNYFEDNYVLNLELKDESLKNLIIYQNTITLPHTDKDLREKLTKEQLLFLISIYSSLKIDSLYFTKDFFTEDIINFSNTLYSKKEIKPKAIIFHKFDTC